jgi:hypothetical protein
VLRRRMRLDLPDCVARCSQGVVTRNTKFLVGKELMG